MKETLTHAADARKLGLSLKGLEYSGELTTQLLESSKKLEKVHAMFQDAVGKSSLDKSQIKKLLAVKNHQCQILEKAKVGFVDVMDSWSNVPKYRFLMLDIPYKIVKP